jgi:hypothetical protein
MEIPQILEAAWKDAYPGREAAEHNAVWRELWAALQRAREPVQPAPYLRLVPRH